MHFYEFTVKLGGGACMLPCPPDSIAYAYDMSHVCIILYSGNEWKFIEYGKLSMIHLTIKPAKIYLWLNPSICQTFFANHF